MADSDAALGEFEQMILLAVLCAQQDDGDAYGVTVHRALTRRTSRRIALGAVYMTLDRLEKKGLLSSTLSAPTAERGGRAKRCYAVTRRAKTALLASQRTLMRLWEGLEPSR
ncbi:MAG TPA: helix-turn-helix transcriptional regulator [Vicinamibacterales bacterium]|jgi:DNA-binding PadR family transcriptional regulator|nr:helix-turn-helix transcriptional regulator [Vicinamibacterales bacterium]